MDLREFKKFKYVRADSVSVYSVFSSERVWKELIQHCAFSTRIVRCMYVDCTWAVYARIVHVMYANNPWVVRVLCTRIVRVVYAGWKPAKYSSLKILDKCSSFIFFILISIQF